MMFVDESGDPGYPPAGKWAGWGGSTHFARVGVIIHGWKWKAWNDRLTSFKRNRGLTWDAEIRASDRALVISGPNAGGKTTAVKTLGVLALMVQCAIPIPADASSVFPVYSGFFADMIFLTTLSIVAGSPAAPG